MAVDEEPSAYPRSELERRRGNPDRVSAFTDGVFAIIITILVLEIAVPTDLAETGLRDALEELGPTLIAWVISFLITGMYWVSHRDLFTRVRYVNRDVVWLNLLFLLPAALIPFAAGLLGEYHGEAIALHIYGAVLIATSLLRLALYSYVVRRPALLWDVMSSHEIRLGRYLSAAPIAVYLLAIALADSAPTASLILYLAVPMLYFALITILRSNAKTPEEADELS